MNYAKIIFIVLVLALLASIAYSVTIHHSSDHSIDSIRAEAQEARSREIQAQKDREAREDSLSQALYDQCYSEAIAGTGSRFERKQKETFSCWREKLEIENKNQSWTVAPAKSGEAWWIIPNAQAYEPDQSTIRSPDTRISSGTNTIQPAHKADRKPVATTHQDKQQIQESQGVYQSPEYGEKKYWAAYSVAIAHIQKWEGLYLTAYPDFWACSIWWGTRARSCSEKISRSEADRRLGLIVRSLTTRIQKDHPKLSSEKQGVLVSFAYNCERGYRAVTKHGLKYHSQWCRSADGIRLQWLVDRRAEEAKILFSK